MPIRSTFGTVLSWAARNERKLGAILFAFGFLTDLLTFGLLPVAIVNWFFVAYLGLAAACTLGTHVIYAFRERDAWWRRMLAVLFPLGAQYALGGLLSGFVVFYTAHSVVLASWPFLLLIAVVYIGNEYFRMHKAHLVFQTALFFFALYAYAIFAMPLLIGSIGPWIFALSTLAAVVAFGLLLSALYLIQKERVRTYLRPIIVSAAGIVVAISLSYFTGLIPPVPLALGQSGIYHSLTRVSGGYVARAEPARPWWDIRTLVVHAPAGAPLYAYSAVKAPIRFSSAVVHRWERRSDGKWVTESRITFPISGGRAEGYRGYSQIQALRPGAWRVSVETPGGAVIGRIRFDVESAAEAPALIEQTL